MTTTTVDPPGTTTATATDAMDVDLETKKPAAEEDNGVLGTSMHSTASATAGTPSMLEDSAEEDDAEEALFLDIEKQEEATEDGDAKPNSPEEAPTLLKAALKKGELANGDAVGKSADVAVKTEDAEAPPSTATNAAEAKANQLDFLLSKASEYSNFIANDLQELQETMSEQARKNMSSKKRKKDGTAKDGDKSIIFAQPKNLSRNCTLKDYQLEGVRWLASLFENGVSGILADEMGLGKTIQCVAVIAHLLTMGVSGPFLVVAPLATLPNWVREFEKWLPSQPVVRYHGPAPDRDRMLKTMLHPKLRRNPNFPVIVTSYEVAIRDQTKLEKLSEFTYVIVDEGHRLKNHRCTLIRSLKKLRAANRLLLTGTPIQNTLDELWSLLNFVNPQIFDDLTVFQSWFGFKDIGQKTAAATTEEDILLEQRKNQTVTKLHEILRPFLLRRIKTDVLSEMPPKKEIVVYSGISKLQAGYADLIDKGTLRATLIAQGIEDGRRLSQTNKLMNHRKNVNHPFLFGEPVDPATGVHIGSAHPQLLIRASGKFALLDRMLTRLYNDQHQVLIFSQMTSVLSVMEDYLNFRKWNYCRIDGSTHIDERQRQMDAFNSEKDKAEIDPDRYFVFLLSTRAGGLGINLTAADTCIIFDSDWNPHADSQAMDRCHRMGQTRPVAVYRLLTVNSVDIEMMEKQVSKKKLERMTIAGGDFRKAGRRSLGEIDVEHLGSLLKSDIKNLDQKAADDVEDVKIDDNEFDMIMDRKRLFAEGVNKISPEGKMYDVIDPSGGDLLGKMDESK